jgi:serine/threonine protein kinase
MDLLRGEALDSLIKGSGHLTVEQALEVFIQAADALASAHVQGIIHRDVKPSNMMLVQCEKTRSARVIIVDFGIARLPKQGVEAQSQTATGLIFGTPYYMSPEQCQGTKVDQRSDIYSFGCALFEALTGTPPFVGDSAFHTFMMHQTEEPPNLAGRSAVQDFPQSLELAVSKMLSKNPGDRYQTMSQVKHDLERIKDGKPIMAKAISNTFPPNIVAPGKALSPLRADGRGNHSNEEEDDSEIKSDAQPDAGKLPLWEIAIFSVALIFVAALGFRWFDWNHRQNLPESKQANVRAPEPPRETKTTNTVRPAEQPASLETASNEYDRSIVFPIPTLKGFGASQAELASVTKNDLVNLESIEQRTETRIDELIKNNHWASTSFMTDGVLHFPKDIFIGAISIDDKVPKLAKGDVPAPPNKDACLYLTTGTRLAPELLDKFGPNDLTGVAMVFADDKVNSAIDKIGTWKRLKDLWFFNPLIKTVTTGTDYWGESKIADYNLPRLDKLPGLRSLGLCDPVSGLAILKRPFLRKLQSIGLRRIQNFEPLLKKLPDCDNLKEVFLMSQDTTDEQLKTLIHMKNLKKLTILRGHLTIDSLQSFRQMKALKELRLDRNDWTTEQKVNFQNSLPRCNVTYEKVIDRQYWPMLSDEHTESEKP